MKHRHHAPLLGTALLLGCVLALTGCSDDPLAPFEPEITNMPDSFQLQATGVTTLSRTLNYDWLNTGVTANVDHSTVTTAGRATLSVYDAGDQLVYHADLVPSLSTETAVGTEGGWRIKLVLENFSGTLNFRLQKP